MKYLVDANLLSEPTMPEHDSAVILGLRRYEAEFAVDPITLGEIGFGIHLVPAGKRRARLERWFADGVQRLRCRPWLTETGLRWAQLLADLRAAGQSMPIKDSLIAATALTHGLTVVTRNARDFAKAGARTIDPLRASGDRP